MFTCLVLYDWQAEFEWNFHCPVVQANNGDILPKIHYISMSYRIIVIYLQDWPEIYQILKQISITLYSLNKYCL